MDEIKCYAFDCFGTVFDMSGVSRDEIRDYVAHVNKQDFTPYDFPASWWDLKLHPDSAPGIKRLQSRGAVCVALSNGSVDLLRHVSERGGVHWDHIVDLAKHKVYKPNRNAYLTVSADLGIPPVDTMMVTANPDFGDVEGASSVGMWTRVIRNGHPNTILELAGEER
jgi:2-haloacid dehalogenase